ncbi:MAG: hypothetical protein KAR62_04715 [Sphingomonadales bacterium]|nr:hypothetical protein [Sphingomonadales bacterium]
MAHEIFSVSTINTKRNLLAVSAVSIIHAFGWIDLTALPFVNGTVNSSTPISWILVVTMAYFSYLTYLHVRKDLGNQLPLPSLDEIEKKYSSFINIIHSYLVTFNTKHNLRFQEIGTDTSEEILEIVKKNEAGEHNLILLGIQQILLTNIRADASIKNNTAEARTSRIKTAFKNEQEEINNDPKMKTNKLQNNLFYQIEKMQQELIKLENDAHANLRTNNRLQDAETTIPCLVATFAIGSLLGNILCS